MLPGDPTQPENGPWYEYGRPAVICSPKNKREYQFMQAAIHEISHAYGLSDVNRRGNVMHFTKKQVSPHKPYEYKGLQPVITGTNKPDNSKGPQNQWEDFKRFD